MATWEDGPEYAPHEPPSLFAAPDVAPLSTAPPRPILSAGAPTRPPPNFTGPQAAPLATIGTGPSDRQRNPQQPFAVNASTLTEGTSAWGAAHSVRNAEPAEQQWAAPAGTPVVATGPPLPTPGAGRDPHRPIHVGSTMATAPGVAPEAPGDAGSAPSPWAPPSDTWAAPSAARSAAPQPGGSGGNASPIRRAVDLLTVPLLISLLLGLIPPISPIMLLVSAVLAFRLEPSMKAVRTAVFAGAGFVIFIGLLSQISQDWWATTTRWSWFVTMFVCLYAGVMAYLRTAGPRTAGQIPKNNGTFS